MTQRFLQQPAAQLAEDEHFYWFLDALQKATGLGVTDMRQRFTEGTVADVLRGPLAGIHRDNLAEVMADVRRAGSREIEGKIGDLERELERLRARLSEWHAFLTDALEAQK